MPGRYEKNRAEITSPQSAHGIRRTPCVVRDAHRTGHHVNPLMSRNPYAT